MAAWKKLSQQLLLLSKLSQLLLLPWVQAGTAAASRDGDLLSLRMFDGVANRKKKTGMKKKREEKKTENKKGPTKGKQKRTYIPPKMFKKNAETIN